MSRIIWKLEKRKIDELKPFDKNPRVITDDSLDELGNSFDEIGNCQPIAIDVDNTILSGHARWMRLKKEGESEVECMVPDRKLTPKQREAVVIRMNKTIAGKWDFEILKDEFELSDLMEWGFEEHELCFEPPETGVDDDEKDQTEKKYLVEVQLYNELEQSDLFDDLVNKGFMVRKK
jgi:hypothetical protein